ncbi:MAG: hypothetical protein A2X19_00055 [Bacteroidetes bacterium GWE2_39_28]|nr:MAG: hypothetical protein A2X19_00055 [Bacteroidetes bacterium GWE2_39_28]OFY14380.1 MAG: hypothetical protein A2X16_05365 [Bacteroidetes bacterium GWF2_39_10]HCT95257.1 hypothetical protein [Rikenellaceae bacterium]
MKKIILSSLVIASLCTSCMKNNEILTERFSEAKLMPTLNSVNSKSLIDDSNITNETIRVNVSKIDGSTSYLTPTESKYTLTHSGTNWVLSDLLYLSTEKAVIYAYAPTPADPATVEEGAYNTLTRKLDVQATLDMANQTDYLWSCQNKTEISAGNDINSTNPQIHLTMNHALSLVSFVIYKENYTGSGAISQVKIGDLSASPSLTVNKAVDNDLKMSVATGAITGGEKTSLVTVVNVGNSITETSLASEDTEVLKTKVNAYTLIVPTTISDKTKVQFTFTIDSKDYSVTLSGVGGLNWIAGQQYIYKVKLSGTQMSIESVNVTPWTNNYSGEVVIN